MTAELKRLETKLETLINGRETAIGFLKEYMDKHNHWEEEVEDYNKKISDLEKQIKELKEPCRCDITITPANFEDIGLKGCILTMKKDGVSLSRDLLGIEVRDLMDKLESTIEED